jgi:hypothetical protein
MCNDFGSGTVMDGNAPSNAPTIFGDPSNGGSGGPCLLEPAVGALFPNNWLRPRFRVKAPAGQNLFEIRLHAANQSPDLVVYTTNTTWTMDKAMWTALAQDTRDMVITVSVRGASMSGGSVAKGTSGNITIAPVGASGTMVYWSTKGSTNGTPTNDETLLSGFAVGDESVVTVLTPGQAVNPPADVMGTPPSHCIGCHTSTPDGLYISYNDFEPWSLVLASGAMGMVGASPPFLRGGGFRAISLPWTGISTYSGGHWADGDHLAVAPIDTGSSVSDTDQHPGLAWFDLESRSTSSTAAALQTDGAWGWIYNAAAGAYAAAPSWSHDGSKVVFTMTNKVVSGRLGTGTAHLYSVPFAKTPGAATALPLTDTSGTADYYGALSHDDQLIAFNRVPAATANQTHMQLDGSKNAWDGMYMQPATEVFVAQVSGGTATRLAANDPPSCSNITSPGINNTWAKWSPEVQTANGKTYYWLIFSSWREGQVSSTGSPIAQLYITGVVRDETGLNSSSAIYLWNQPADISNHTPAWDVFQIPAVP